jgi:hypothetical protein
VQDSKTSVHPSSWRWDEDGRSVRGTYVRMDEAATDYGRSAIVVLDVGGEERSVWLFEAAIVSKFRDELAKRPSGDFTAGERVEIDRGADKVESANGRSYWPYRVRFPDAPKRSAASILGIGAESEHPVDDDSQFASDPASDDIPF